MIYNQWYVILESREVKNKKPIKVTRLNQDLTLWRDENNQVCCISDKCCHRGASLSCGKIVDGKVECPFHGFLFVGFVTGENQPTHFISLMDRVVFRLVGMFMLSPY